MTPTPDPKALLDEAERLMMHITPGEWEDGYVEHGGDAVCSGDVLVAGGMTPVNAAFIAAAPRLVRQMADALATLQESRERAWKEFGEADRAVDTLSEKLEQAEASLAAALQAQERMREALEQITVDDYGPEGGRILKGNDELPGEDIQQFYRGFNSGIDRQFKKTAEIARKALAALTPPVSGGET